VDAATGTDRIAGRVSTEPGAPGQFVAADAGLSVVMPGSHAAAVSTSTSGATMPRRTMTALSTSWTGSRHRHAHRGSEESEFGQRAAVAWIRAADAGLIDASELGWLLGKLSELQGHTEVRTVTDDQRPGQ
jgi:hypothetical protein